jgi:metallo-beta-lactamase class B
MRPGTSILWLLVLCCGPVQSLAQTGRTWTREEILARTVNPSREQQLAAWPPHRIIDNVYYVGTQNLGAFLVTTPGGHILINSTYEETLPLVRQSVEELGFRVEDIRIILGSHAHADHMSGNALLKAWSGGEVMVMAEDLPLLEQLTPGVLVDRVLGDEDQVTLGEETLTARLTPGHTPGTTTWTLAAEEDGRSYQVVVLGGGVAPRARLAGQPEIQTQFRRTFDINRSLECDVPLGPHTPMYRMEEKFRRLGEGANPFIDPEGCQEEMYLQEQAFRYRLEEQTEQLPEGEN